jgi:hypothetical protein
MILQEFLDRAAALKRKSAGAAVASLSYHVRPTASSLARQRIGFFARQRTKSILNTPDGGSGGAVARSPERLLFARLKRYWAPA